MTHRTGILTAIKPDHCADHIVPLSPSALVLIHLAPLRPPRGLGTRNDQTSVRARTLLQPMYLLSAFCDIVDPVDFAVGDDWVVQERDQEALVCRFEEVFVVLQHEPDLAVRGGPVGDPIL